MDQMQTGGDVPVRPAADAAGLVRPAADRGALVHPTADRGALVRPAADRVALVHPAADRAAVVRRAAARLCARLGWAPLHEVPLPNGRRADIIGLRPDGGFACIEVKSCARDFQTDAKWPEYRAFCDRLYFAVDADFPAGLLPAEVGMIVADGLDADLLREAPDHPLAPARRRSLLHRFATLAALRLASRDDPGWDAALRTALRVE